MKTASILVNYCLGVKDSEQVAIIADYDSDFLVVNALASATLAVGGEPTVTLMPPRKKWGNPPTRIVEHAVKGADVVISPASTSMYHSKAILLPLQQKKIRYLSMPKITTEMMTIGPGTMTIPDYDEMRRLLEDTMAPSVIESSHKEYLKPLLWST